MHLDLDDTIAAIASAPGGAARGIVRLSGPAAIGCTLAVFQPAQPVDPAAVAAPSVFSGAVRLANLGAVPARAYLWPTARSYTRQPAAELHLIGSPPIVEAALAAICVAGARLARPGEFTLRAFLAGRIDLTQAEAVLGVIDATGQASLHTALAQLAGGLAQPLAKLRESLLDLLAHLEAGLDFVEEDIEFIAAAQLQAQLASAEEQLAQIAAQLAGRGAAGELPRVVLAGPPNAGKSSLLNALAGEGAAIVSPIAGTTRDFVARRLRIGDCECLLIDTAGLDEAIPAGELATRAAAATREQLQQADLVVHCRDALLQPEADVQGPGLMAWTKCDLLAAGAALPEGGIATSSRTGQGLEKLNRAIAERLVSSGAVASTASRCRESVRLAAAALWRASSAARAEAGQELVAAEVRLALDELGQVVGAVYTEDLLDRVFSRFCIGK
ncbi:MAG TPA: GTPase [Pirellulaceae bacterium]|nr:GTPase [Pirellulaceae bacterium]